MHTLLLKQYPKIHVPQMRLLSTDSNHLALPQLKLSARVPRFQISPITIYHAKKRSVIDFNGCSHDIFLSG